MSGDKLKVGVYSLENLTEVIHLSAELGTRIALAENEGDSRSAGEGRRLFESRLAEMPRNALGGFYIFGDAAIASYIEGYVKHKIYDIEPYLK